MNLVFRWSLYISLTMTEENIFSRFTVPAIDNRGANINTIWRVKLYPKVRYHAVLFGPVRNYFQIKNNTSAKYEHDEMPKSLNFMWEYLGIVIQK